MHSLVVVAALLLVAACGREEHGKVAYERVTVERFLAGEVARTAPDLPVGPVTCPRELPARVGTSAFCAVVLDGVATSYVVEVLAGKRFEARPEHPIVDLRQITAQITEKAGAGATVNCGATRVVQMTPGQRVVCAIKGGGPDRNAVVTADPDGTIRVADL